MPQHSSLNPIDACDAPASMDSWELFNGFVEQQTESILGNGRAAYQMRLACEELFSNIIRHASCNKPDGSIAHLWVRALKATTPNPALVIELEDTGTPFDPKFNINRNINVDQAIQERPIGGLGLFLVQNSVDHVEYALVDGRNRYRLYSSLPED